MEVNASLINFAAGQLSKKFLARVDLANFYKAGALLCRNFIPQAQGPAEFRPGSQKILHTRLNGLTSLYPFIFNDEQAYSLAFSDEKLRFFSDGGVIMDSAGETQHQFLAHFNGVDGATTYTAESGQILDFKGDAQLDTAQKEFGTASLLLDGTGDYVEIPDDELLAFGTDDFTFDCWMRPTTAAATDTIIGSSSSGFIIYKGSATSISVYRDWGTVVTFTVSAMSDATWYHLAVVRKDGMVYLFLNGVLQDVPKSLSQDIVAGGTPQIGVYGTSNAPFGGHLDEISIRKGVAIWTSDFVVPTAEYSSSGIVVITDVSQADPGVVTASSHGYSDGDEIYISGIEGMTELNNRWFYVVYIDTNTFSLTDIDGNAIDTSAYTAYTSGGTCDSIYEIATPYLEEDLAELKFAQKADLMYIIHPDYEPRKLIRSGETSWALSTFTRTADPFTKTITGITAADPGVVTATAHGFENGDLVEIWGVVGMTEVNGNTYQVANKATDTFELTDPTTGEDIDTSGYTAYTSGGYAFKQSNMPGAGAFYGGRMFYGGTLDDPETFWGSKAPTNAGVVQYDDFTVGSSAEDAVTFPISSQNNTADRIQWFAGVSRFLAIGTFGGVYKANGGSDTTPISGTAIAVQPIEFVGCKSLAPVRVGSSLFYVQRGGLILNNFAFSLMADDYRATSLNIFSDEITKTGIVQLTTQQGSSDIIWAVTTEGKLIGMTVKVGEEINAWHSHELGGTDVKVLSVCGEPQPDNRDSLWAVVERTVNGVTRRYIEYFEAEDPLPEKEDYYTGDKDDDDTKYKALLYEAAKHLIRVDSALTYDASQTIPLTPAAVGGLTTFTADGDLFSASDVGRYIVKKVITGEETGVAKITEYVSATVVNANILETFDSLTKMGADEWFLSVSSVSGLDHLEGEEVQVQIDGADGGLKTVASGAITLDTYGTVIHVGLPYVGHLQTMPLDIGALVGTAQAKTTTVNKLGLLVRNTLGVKYGTDLYSLEQLKSRDYNERFCRPPALVTDALELRSPDGYDRRKFIHIVQDTPFPCTIQGIIPFVDTTNE